MIYYILSQVICFYDGRSAYFDFCVNPTAKPMISASSARNTARSASKKIFRFMPKYFLCGGIAVSNLSLSDGFVD